MLITKTILFYKKFQAYFDFANYYHITCSSRSHINDHIMIIYEIILNNNKSELIFFEINTQTSYNIKNKIEHIQHKGNRNFN